MSAPTAEQRAIIEWGDAVAAINGWPGSPTREMIMRLLQCGDDMSALLAASPAPAGDGTELQPSEVGRVGRLDASQSDARMVHSAQPTTGPRSSFRGPLDAEAETAGSDEPAEPSVGRLQNPLLGDGTPLVTREQLLRDVDQAAHEIRECRAVWHLAGARAETMGRWAQTLREVGDVLTDRALTPPAVTRENLIEIEWCDADRCPACRHNFPSHTDDCWLARGIYKARALTATPAPKFDPATAPFCRKHRIYKKAVAHYFCEDCHATGEAMVGPASAHETALSSPSACARCGHDQRWHVGFDHSMWCQQCACGSYLAQVGTNDQPRLIPQAGEPTPNALKVIDDLVRFQTDYQRLVCDSAPGNELYAGKLLAVVDEARKVLGMPPRPSVYETMDQAAAPTGQAVAPLSPAKETP